MYRRILLTSDGTREGLVALREGALLARGVRASAFLLIVDYLGPAMRLADGIHPMAREEPRSLLGYGLQRLEDLGVSAQGRVVSGEPVVEIANYAKWFGADLVVLGHRRQSLLERWWAGASGAYVADCVSCSVMVARNDVSDLAFEGEFLAAATSRSP
jgi:nucleotide-binding universal stress UspA family protein